MSDLQSAPARESPGLHEQTRHKRLAAERGVDYVQSGMVVGLGAASTARLFINRLARLFSAGQLRDIVGIPCSREAAEEAVRLGIELHTLDDCPVVDLTIHGADGLFLGIATDVLVGSEEGVRHLSRHGPAVQP
jgi:ribose 5-phosphate isomerase